ncbi:MAG: polysaccharide biosynthesis/export family protein [Desulfococcaceae bacterium]
MDLQKLYRFLLLFAVAGASTGVASSALAQGEGYHVAPGDVLSLTIFAGGAVEHSVQLRVSEQGEVNVPFLGAVQVEGLTLPELQNRIYEPLAADYYVNPEINLYVTDYRTFKYYITGAVNSPGLYESHSEQTLLKLLAQAGGSTDKRSGTAYILRDATEQIQEGENVEELLSETEPLKVDLQKLVDQGDLRENIVLEPGDVVYIPSISEEDIAESSIFVQGEVKRPGEYAYKEGMTALNACIIAGGFAKFAAPNRTKVVRKEGDRQKIYKINLNDVIDGDIPDMQLQPGDIVSVPESWF